jgi:hypothetical protein
MREGCNQNTDDGQKWREEEVSSVAENLKSPIVIIRSDDHDDIGKRSCLILQLTRRLIDCTNILNTELLRITDCRVGKEQHPPISREENI